MSLIFLVYSSTCKCFVCDSGTREKKRLKSTWVKDGYQEDRIVECARLL
jgi:hypothetical protein